MDAAVEGVAGNHVLGWARDPERPGPAIVQILAGGTRLAEASARLFRPELLAAGIGHGHYGFRARLRQRPEPGSLEITLLLPQSGRGITARIDVPAKPGAVPVTVESLIQPEPGWTVQHVRDAPAGLRLAANLEAMGPSRFVDMLFHFALRRWPAPHEARFHAAMLAQREVGPDELLLELLGSRERADLDPALASPWAADFPFLAA